MKLHSNKGLSSWSQNYDNLKLFKPAGEYIAQPKLTADCIHKHSQIN